MALCDLCLNLTPNVKQYRHHASFADLVVSAAQCELCLLLSVLLEKNGHRKTAEEYRATVNGQYGLVNDTSITISGNKHQLPKNEDDVSGPILYHQLVVTCGPISRHGFFAENPDVQAPVQVVGIYAEEGCVILEMRALQFH